ncbi:MAG: Holliday junction resolvase RuvX [Bacilli bacterium]|nr:Holliday junction resolvase RuvX [Bacilli bacterium]
MRYLGLDLGTRTLGISMSDLTGTIATAYQTIRFADSDYESVLKPLGELIQRENVKELVLGLPKNMNNTMGERCETTLTFKELLEKTFSIKVHLQDERLSTVEATNYMIKADMSRKKRKNKIDSLAANIILQSYLDKRKGE